MELNKIFQPHEQPYKVNPRTGAADNDIALIQLEPTGKNDQCLRFDNVTRPICLPRRADYLKTNDDCYITGWGYTGTGFQVTFKLNFLS